MNPSNRPIHFMKLPPGPDWISWWAAPGPRAACLTPLVYYLLALRSAWTIHVDHMLWWGQTVTTAIFIGFLPKSCARLKRAPAHLKRAGGRWPACTSYINTYIQRFLDRPTSREWQCLAYTIAYLITNKATVQPSFVIIVLTFKHNIRLNFD